MRDDSAQRAVPLIAFTDKDGKPFWLSPKALHHVQHDNCIEHPKVLIEHVFRHTVAIIESRWKPETYLYYAPYQQHYATVVVNTRDRRIKTAYISDKIKGGVRIWVSPRLTS